MITVVTYDPPGYEGEDKARCRATIDHAVRIWQAAKEDVLALPRERGVGSPERLHGARCGAIMDTVEELLSGLLGVTKETVRVSLQEGLL